MRPPAMKVFFSVGEPSGDLHGANLIRALRERSDEPIEAVGYGGPRMAEAGARLHFDLTQLAVMGFLQVLWKLPSFFRLKWRAERYFRAHRPDAVVLIDFPGFNWHIAQVAKRHGVPVFYYGTPQVWGWASWRVKRLRRYVDHALCKLPFEEAWLRERGVNAHHVGHPYFDELATRTLDEAFIRREREARGDLVALLPGSRTQEVRANFSAQLDAAKRVLREAPETRFAVAAFKPAHAERCRQEIAAAGFPEGREPRVFVEKTPELIEAATCCVAVSGSVSLELLYHAKPTVIVYRVSRFAYRLQARFRRVPYITLVNLLTAPELFPDRVGVYERGEPRHAHALMPEYLTAGDPSADLAHHVLDWLRDDAGRERLRGRMGALRERVGAPGASRRAADYFVRHVGVTERRAAAA